jgi:hypothetical protein
MRGVEVSVVGSPEVFGATSTITGSSSSAPVIPTGDERVIERCDLLVAGESTATVGDRRPLKKRGPGRFFSLLKRI